MCLYANDSYGLLRPAQAKGKPQFQGPGSHPGHLNVTLHVRWKWGKEQVATEKEGAVPLRLLWLTQPQSLMIPGMNPRGWDHARSEGKCCHLVPLKKCLKKPKSKKRGLSWWYMLDLQWCQCCRFSPRELWLSFCRSKVLPFCVAYKRLPCEGICWISKEIVWKSAFYSGLPTREISLSINIVFKAGDFRKDGFKQSPLGQSITYTCLFWWSYTYPYQETAKCSSITNPICTYFITVY